ncbi:MAG: cell division protein FtsH, partial [Oscillospiraceae bacterium]|nr:cell division protein FtsH [Oscillospiraceae bacterium]
KRVSWGPEKKSRVVTPENKFNTATHEVGHAIVMRKLPHCDPIDELSVIQRGRALGYTSYIPSDDRTSLTRGKMLDEIAGLMGGRMAEKIRLSDISTGASNDLKRATELARRMVTEFGMSEEVGPVFLAGDAEVFIGREWGHQREYSETMAADIDREVRRILEEAAERAGRIIEENAEAMTRVIDALVEHEHISGAEFDRLLEGAEDWEDKPAAEAEKAPAADTAPAGEAAPAGDAAPAEDTAPAADTAPAGDGETEGR